MKHQAVERFASGGARSDDWLSQTIAALRVLRGHGQPAGPVILVLPPHLTLTKLIRTPRVSAAKRDKIVRFEAAQGIPYNLAEVTWETVVAHEGAANLELLLAAAKLEVVNALAKAATEVGFEPGVILPAPLATLAAYRLVEPESSTPTAEANLGARSAAILQVEGQRFAMRTAALGSSGFSAQIAANLTAEAASHAGSVDAYATKLGQEITRSVMHFGRQGMAKPGRIFLTGGTARLPGLTAALAARLKLHVEPLDVAAAMDIAPECRATVAAGGGIDFTDLVGAAATEVFPSHPALNLLPAGLKRRGSLRRRQPWLVGAIGLAVAALVPPILHFHHLAAAARVKTAGIEGALAPSREREVRIRAGLGQLEQLRHEAAQLEGVHQRRTSWLRLMADFEQRLVQVEDVWFERLRTIPPSGDMPLKLAVSGRMLDKTNPVAKVSPETFSRVQALLAGLADSPFVSAVEGERFDHSQPGILRFDFVLVTNPAHPL